MTVHSKQLINICEFIPISKSETKYFNGARYTVLHIYFPVKVLIFGTGFHTIPNGLGQNKRPMSLDIPLNSNVTQWERLCAVNRYSRFLLRFVDYSIFN